jgi:hypothetical protein
MTKLKVAGVVLAGVLGVSGQALARDPIPEESGLSGSLALGAGALDYSSNTVVGTSFFDAADDTINDLGSPGSDSTAIPVFSYSLKYTFAESRTQLFAGNALPDFLSFDFASQFGVRKAFGGIGILGVAYLKTSFPAKVWEDPYLTGTRRNKTDRTSDGVALKWEQMFDSHFTVELRSRKISIDDELSGQSIVPPLSDPKNSLGREGDQQSLEVLYEYALDKENLIVPSFTYTNFDLDGNAVKNERYVGQLSYAHLTPGYNLIVNGSYGTASYDKSNPVFGEKNGADIYGLAANIFFKQPFGLQAWQAFAGAGYYKEDTDISFYTTEATLFNIGMLYKF